MYILLSVGLLLAAVLGYLIFRREPAELFVLAYEKIGAAPKQSRLQNQWTTAASFEKMLLWLRAHEFMPVSMEKLQTHTAAWPRKPVLLAFLGGYQSFITEIFPLLQKYKTPAALFLPPALAGTYNAWQNPQQEPWQNLLTIAELKTIQKSGLVSFGAMALEGEDLTQTPLETARYLAGESLFRLGNQLGLKPQGFAFWPAKEFDIKKAVCILPDGFKGIILTPQKGSCQTSKKNPFFRILFPSQNIRLVYYILWKHR